MSVPLKQSEIPSSNTGRGLIPQLDLKQTEKIILKTKKCNSRVEGDIPKDFINPCVKSLAIALTPIYNACLLNKEWPDLWKIETVISIP